MGAESHKRPRTPTRFRSESSVGNPSFLPRIDKLWVADAVNIPTPASALEALHVSRVSLLDSLIGQTFNRWTVLGHQEEPLQAANPNPPS